MYELRREGTCPSLQKTLVSRKKSTRVKKICFKRDDPSRTDAKYARIAPTLVATLSFTFLLSVTNIRYYFQRVHGVSTPILSNDSTIHNDNTYRQITYLNKPFISS